MESREHDGAYCRSLRSLSVNRHQDRRKLGRDLRRDVAEPHYMHLEDLVGNN